METKFKNDPKNYYKMSQPHSSAAAANEAIAAFYEKVEAARFEHKISDILVVIKDSVMYEDGDVGQFFQHSQYGKGLNGPQMAAYLHGQMQAEERQMLNKLLAGQ